MSDNRKKSESAWEQGLSRTFYVQDHTVISVVGLDSSEGGQGKAEKAPLRTGRVIDNKYKLLSLLGEGGMGAVYRAHHLSLDKEVALKTFLHSQIDTGSRQRFEQEVKAIARLSHQNIVQVFDFGISREFGEQSGEGARPFYTMELLRGRPLSAMVEASDLSSRAAKIQMLDVFIQVASGLAYAHKMGIVHRDIKPDNIFICDGVNGPSVTKIVDFGIAKMALADKDIGGDSLGAQSTTQVGLIFGSPLYMSPEQSMGLSTDERTDIYSFGCTLFQALTGRPPFFGNSSMATIMAHQTQPPPKVSDFQPDADWPRRLEALMASLLQKNIEKRPRSFENIRLELLDIVRTLSLGDDAPYTPKVKDDTLDISEESAFPLKLVAAAVIVLVSMAALVGAYFYFSTGHKKLTTANGPTYAQTFDIKQVAGKGDTKEVQVGHYLQEVTANSKVFVFPHLEYSLGQIGERKKTVAAEGRVEIPAGKVINFEAGAEILKHPVYISGFGPSDLQAFAFSPQVTSFGDNHLERVSQLYGLHHINLDNCELSEKSVVYINRLTGLDGIELFHQALDSKYWLKLDALTKSRRLGLDHCTNLKAVLKKLVLSGVVANVTFYYCLLDDEDLRLIGQLKNLNYLHFSGGSGLTPKNFKLLLGLNKLEHLEVDGGYINVVDFDSLERLPALKRCTLYPGNLSNTAMERYRQDLAVKHVKVSFSRPYGKDDF